MELRRNDAVYATVSYLTRKSVMVAYTPTIVGLDNLPPSGPVLLLPKHQKYVDIPLENILLREVSRKGNWVMKDGLPKWFELFGGISIKRAKDVRKIKDRGKRKIAVEEARKQKLEVMDYISFLYDSGEVVVMHPEGTRCPDKVGERLKMDFVDQAVELSKSGRINISLIPLGFDYYGKNVVLTVGKPISHNSNNLELIIRENLASLSSIKL